MPKYATYYDCSGWKSLVEVMNPAPETRVFTITAFDRNASPIFEMTTSIGGHQSIRIDLNERIKISDRGPNAEGLVLVEPETRTGLNVNQEFPAVLIIAPADTKDDHEDYFKWNRFVPFTRIP